MWTYTFTYKIEGVATSWVVQAPAKTATELVEMFDNNNDIPNGIQCTISGVLNQ